MTTYSDQPLSRRAARQSESGERQATPPPFAPSSPFSMTEISRYDARGPAWYWNDLRLGEHTGTHFDAPAHWVTGSPGATCRTARSTGSTRGA